jgi:hypothetical protein
MKKLLIILAVISMVFVASSAFAQLRLSSDAITTDTLLVTVKAPQSVGLCGIFLVADGTNAASVTVYDNTSATGKKLRTLTVAAGEYYGGFVLPTCIKASTGLYVDVGTNTTVFIDYVK